MGPRSGPRPRHAARRGRAAGARLAQLRRAAAHVEGADRARRHGDRHHNAVPHLARLQPRRARRHRLHSASRRCGRRSSPRCPPACTTTSRARRCPPRWTAISTATSSSRRTPRWATGTCARSTRSTSRWSRPPPTRRCSSRASPAATRARSRRTSAAYEFRGIAFFDTALSIWDALDGELNGEDYRRALALINREPNPESGMFFGSSEKTRPLGGDQRLVALVRAAVHGLGTNFELPMMSIDEATLGRARRAQARGRESRGPARPRPAWCRATWGGGELGPAAGQARDRGDRRATRRVNVDATISRRPQRSKLLRGLGGVDTSTVYDHAQALGRRHVGDLQERDGTSAGTPFYDTSGTTR